MLNLILLIAFLFIFILIYFRLAKHFNIADAPNERSSHRILTIRGGGIVFFLAAFVYFLYSEFSYSFFIIGLTSISAVSFLDDVFTLKNRYRMPFQLLAIFLILFELDVLSNTYLIWIPVYLIAGVGILNAYNFMDGINGITGFYSISVLTTLWIVNNFHVHFIDNDLIYFLGCGLLVFGFFNFRNRAICFAGDVGSIGMATIIVFLIAKLSLIQQNLLYFTFLMVYGVDTILTIVHRLILKQNIFKAHRFHLYQVLVHDHGYSHLSVAFSYALIQLLISLYLINTIDHQSSGETFLASGIFILILSFVYLYFKFIKKTKKKTN